MSQSQLKKQRRLEREARTREKLQRAAEGELRGCLVCRRRDGGFLSEEHPMPESMANTDIVLPNGVICDRCNGGPLSDLDKELCDFFPVKMRRTMLGIQSKGGKVPVSRFATGSLRNDGVTPDGEAALFFQINSAKDKRTLYEKSRVGAHVELGMNVKGGRPLTPRYASELARSLLKCAFECAWLDHGATMLEERFDHVRDAILGEPYSGLLAVLRKGQPTDSEVSITYNFRTDQAVDAMWVFGSFFGVRMFTDSRLGEPVNELPEADVVTITFRSEHWRGGKPEAGRRRAQR
jgi:hypothetical protein